MLKEVAGLLVGQGKTLALAESCTGGLVGHLLTNMPGSSRYLVGGVVAYHNRAKRDLLDVSQETLDTQGAVSAASATQMARKIRQLLDTDIGIGITGIAGPTGGTPEKPVGLVYIALCARDGSATCREFLWHGSRRANKASSARAALEMLRDYLIAKQ